MNAYLFFFMASLLLRFSGAMQADDSRIAARVIEADKQLNKHIMTHNATEARPYYADNFILTASSGKRKNKYDMLNDIANKDIVWERNETTDISVQSLGSTAVLTGILHQKGSFQGKNFDNTFFVTDTWVLTEQRIWVLLAGHATILPNAVSKTGQGNG